MEFRDERHGAGGGRLTKEAHDRAMLLNKGPLVGSRYTFEQPTQRPASARTTQRPR